MKLRGKVAIVTGASRGIGRGIALAYAREGACVVVNGRQPDTVEAVGAEIRAAGAHALAFAGDVGQPGVAEALVGLAVEAFGQIDILVNAAGIIRMAPLVETTDEDWDEILRVNARGVFYCCRAAARQMIAQGHGGRIINLSSRGGKVGTEFATAYSASKFAVVGITHVAARELAPHGINVNAICPGRIDTQMMQETVEQWGAHLGISAAECRTRLLAEIPKGRMGTTDEVGRLALFLASDESTYITGQSMQIGGGLDLS